MTELKKGWLERREYERVKDILKVSYYRTAEESPELSDDYRDTTVEKLQMVQGNRLITSMTDDVSRGGLAIITDEPLAQGDKLIIDLYIPQASSPVKLLAEVMRLEGLKGNDTKKAGLKIISISKNDLKRLESHLSGLNKNK
ncbi:MAG: PilZ domain-containing protein [Candidatus Goldbacteria bacterium]|nr:PilZ domain-containing protein [Candidatus Goldiibacteriota bacterium]